MSGRKQRGHFSGFPRIECSNSAFVSRIWKVPCNHEGSNFEFQANASGWWMALFKGFDDVQAVRRFCVS